jgi:hypothetical protein
MINYRVIAGATDVSVVIRIIDSADGTPETGVISATTGLALEYRRSLSASVGLTESDLAALTTAHSDGGMKHIGNGYYRVDVPDAAFAAGAAGCLIHGTATGMIVVGAFVHLDPVPSNVLQWNSQAMQAAEVGNPGVGARFTAASGSTSTAVLPGGASSTDDFYRGWFFRPVSGTGAGHGGRWCTQYTGSSKSAVFAGRNFSFTVDSTTVFELYPGEAPSTDSEIGTAAATAVFARAFDGTKMAGYTFEELTGFVASVLLGQAAGLDTATGTFRNLGDTGDAVVGGGLDDDGNRATVTLDPTAIA